MSKPSFLCRLLDVLTALAYLCAYTVGTILIPGLLILFASAVLSMITHIHIALWIIGFACLLETVYKDVFEKVEDYRFQIVYYYGRLLH